MIETTEDADPVGKSGSLSRTQQDLQQQLEQLVALHQLDPQQRAASAADRYVLAIRHVMASALACAGFEFARLTLQQRHALITRGVELDRTLPDHFGITDQYLLADILTDDALPARDGVIVREMTVYYRSRLSRTNFPSLTPGLKQVEQMILQYVREPRQSTLVELGQLFAHILRQAQDLDAPAGRRWFD